VFGRGEKAMGVRQFWDGRRASALAVVALSAALVAPAARAQDMSGYYKATVIVTGYDMRQRPLGFALTLKEVLVKVSGESKLRDDPRVAALAAHADTLVSKFDYVDPIAAIKVHDDQGTYDRSYNLTVQFDPAKIDRTLADLGEKPWRGERPVVVPVLIVRGYKPPYLLSAENPAAVDQRGALANSAEEFGIGVRVPTEAELADWGVSPGSFPAPKAEPSPSRIVVAGTVEFKEALPGWVGTWRARWNGADYSWSISGVNFDKAVRDAVRGALRIASGHGGAN
jgi:uncharacterized protein